MRFRFARSVILAFVLPLLSGCHSIGSPELLARSLEMQDARKSEVSIYLLNSPIDPLRFGRLGDMARFLRKAGFTGANFRAWSSGDGLADDIRTLRRRDPGQPVAIIAWSGASLWAWDSAHALMQTDPQSIDLLIILDSNWIKNRVRDEGWPSNIDRTVLIYREKNPIPEGIADPIVYRVPTSNHLAVPASDEAVEAITLELLRLSLRHASDAPRDVPP